MSFFAGKAVSPSPQHETLDAVVWIQNITAQVENPMFLILFHACIIYIFYRSRTMSRTANAQ
jgi:hypothetical protein